MSNSSTSNVTSGFIDLATYDELEKYMYGGPDATAYFVRETRKSTWFTQVPVTLSKQGSSAFGAEWSATISRAGDYLLAAWLRVTIPSVTLAAANTYGANGRLRWTKNLMHNLVKTCSITFNDLVAARFDSYHLDFWSAFTVPAGKRNAYNNMIGSIDTLINAYASGAAIPAATLNLPLPFFFGRDSGVALPTAALPYNDMRINFEFRNWNELLILDNSASTTNVSGAPVVADVGGTAPVLGTTQVWANYAIVSNEERTLMGQAPRDILIEQVQTAPLQAFAPATQPTPTYDIRFSHAIKALFFGCRNTTTASEWSNYTAAQSVSDGTAIIDFAPSGAVDPIVTTTLTYENTARLANMGSDYFSLINPWFDAPVVPTDTGYHMYSYSLDFMALDPMGSTNFGKLTNVSIAPQASTGAITGAAGGQAAATGQGRAQTFQFVCTAVNNNVIRISGGALGFPVL
jgi:hypothetical protein